MTRVVITGMSAISALGKNTNELMKNIYAGNVGISKIEKFDSSKTGVSLAAEIKEFDPTDRIEKKKTKRMDLFSQYALYSAIDAMEQAGINKSNTDSEDMGVIYGSGIGGLTTIQEQVTKMNQKGVDYVSPMFVPKAIGNMAAANIAINLDAQNICTTIVTACSSGANAIGEAYRQIKEDRAQVMITGGSEASINDIGIGGFAALSTLSTETNPTKASIPFDKNRKGFVMGEGGATLILESLEHAINRGANILGEIVGYGTNCDAYHITSPNPNGEIAAKAMNLAIKEAKIEKSEIGYINAHGTSTMANDSSESTAINNLFGKNNGIPVSSTKSMTGHLLGAAGAIEAIITVSALKDSTLPPNAGLNEQDENCDINVVKVSQKVDGINYALSNSFGFGGHNAVLLFKKWSDK